ADDVVIHRCAGHHVSASFVDVGGLIDDYRRVAWASADGALAAGHGFLHDAGAAGDDQHADALVAHELLGGFNGRLSHGGDDVRRSAGAGDGLVEEADVV